MEISEAIEFLKGIQSKDPGICIRLEQHNPENDWLSVDMFEHHPTGSSGYPEEGELVIVPSAFNDKESAREVLGLDNDTTRDLSIRITEKLISSGWGNADEDDDSYDPNAPYSFPIQDIVHGEVNKLLGIIQD